MKEVFLIILIALGSVVKVEAITGGLLQSSMLLPKVNVACTLLYWLKMHFFITFCIRSLRRRGFKHWNRTFGPIKLVPSLLLVFVFVLRYQH